MADFNFGQYLDPITGAVNEGFGNIMSDPRMAGALLSAAGQLAQPVQFGQSPVGALFQGLGAGGESVRAQDTAAEKTKELDSKQALRESQAGAAEARSGAAASRVDTASARLGIQQKEQELRDVRSKMQGGLRLQALYQKEKSDVQARNAKAASNPLVTGFQPEPVPTWPEFLQKNSTMARMTGLLGDETPAAAPDETVSTAPNEGLPQAIPGQSNRPAGYYSTPKGRAYWNGSGWQF
jgi:hypothetical protein